MSEAFPNWPQYAVPQRRLGSGCIATGYEMMLNSAGISGIDFATFQDDFDLDKDRKSPDDPLHNNFETVAKAVNAKYPHVNFEALSFPSGQGSEKVSAIERLINEGRLVLVSLSLGPAGHPGAWHICPVVNATETQFHILWLAKADGSFDVRAVDKTEMARIHNTYPGGDNIAFLAR